jgi:hypothetical protein
LRSGFGAEDHSVSADHKTPCIESVYQNNRPKKNVTKNTTKVSVRVRSPNGFSYDAEYSSSFATAPTRDGTSIISPSNAADCVTTEPILGWWGHYVNPWSSLNGYETVLIDVRPSLLFAGHFRMWGRAPVNEADWPGRRQRRQKLARGSWRKRVKLWW